MLLALLVGVFAPGARADIDEFASPYARWENGPPTDPNFFPIGVWTQNPRNAKRYRAIGINLYVGLWQGPTKEQLNQLKINKMPVICDQNLLGLQYKDEKIIIGWSHMDEPDNAQPDGKPNSYGPPIPPKAVIKSCLRMREKDPTRPVFLNLGQGVAWDNWWGRGERTNHPEDYAEYAKGCDILSFDIYPVVHEQPEVSGNLWFVAKGVERLRKWSEDKKIVWNALECTSIRTERKPTPQQVRTEVWMSLIHGSRGIVYFAHAWYPAFNETALLDDPVMSAAVKEINREVQGLAPVLNSPTLEGRMTVESSNPGVPVAAMVKEHDAATYLFAVAMRSVPTKASFLFENLKEPMEVEALGEDRKLTLDKGLLEDAFEPYAVHLYRIGGAME